MKMSFRIIPLALLSILFLTGYKTGTEPNAGLLVKIDNVAGDQDLKLETGLYTNAAGEQFSVSELQYFISNIELRKKGGGYYALPQDSSYFLIQENKPSTQVLNLKVPAGEYDHIRFILGVDSVRNTMDISRRTGVLDPGSSMDNGMYWGWNSGYIFFKMEGNSEAAPADPIGRHKFRYHIGGFGGYDAPTLNNIKTVELDLTRGEVIARSGKESVLELKADILKVFNGETNVSISQNPNVMFSRYSAKIAANYSHMFSHHRTQNN